MNVDYIRTLYNYHYGMYNRIWDCIKHLTDEQFVQEVDYSIGSVRNHMLHVLEIDQRWVARLQDHVLPEYLSLDEYVTRNAVRSEWDKTVEYVIKYINKVDEDELARTMNFDFSDQTTKRVYTSPVWEVLMHVANHGTDHRAQVLRVLHDLGAPTLEQDLLWWDTWDIEN